MVANSGFADGEAPFTVEGNVLKGKPKMFNTTYTSVGQLLVDGMRKASGKIGQIDSATDKQETFGEMLDRTIKCAIWMKKQGVRPGDVVSLCSHNHMDTFVPCVAAVCIGAIINSWDHKMNAHTGRYFATLSEPKIIFANTSSAKVCLEVLQTEALPTKVVVFGDHPGAIPFSEILKGHSKAEVEQFECEKIQDPHATAVILFTSATTGPPKGVELSHYSLVCSLTMDAAWDFAREAPLWFSSMYWITGIFCTYQSIVNGATRIVCSDYDEELTCKLIQKYQISWLLLSTSMANRLAKSGFISRYDVSSLKTIFTGGALLKREAQDELQKQLPKARIIQAYGQTEAGGLVCYQLPDTPSGSCGVVLPNAQLKFIDINTGEAVGPNKPGEIYIKSPAMSKGYYKNPEVTKQTIDSDGWLHSGDLGYYNEKGEVFIIDRLKEIIKYRGCQVSPGEIENLLCTHPSVLESAVVGVLHPTDDEHPMAFVRVKPGSKVTAQELIDLVDRNLMDHERLRGGVKFLDAFPYTTSGKISRRELKEMARSTAS